MQGFFIYIEAKVFQPEKSRFSLFYFTYPRVIIVKPLLQLLEFIRPP